jgi:hypothetical protein
MVDRGGNNAPAFSVLRRIAFPILKSAIRHPQSVLQKGGSLR